MAERPATSPIVLPFLQAYYDLRPEAPEYDGSITWRSVSKYSHDLGFSSEYMEYMFDVLRAAQGVLFEWESTQSR